MSTSVAELIVRLNDQASGGANNVAKAHGAIAKAEADIGKQSAELKKRRRRANNLQ